MDATTTITDGRLGNCPRCGTQLTEAQFEAGSIEGPPKDGWATFERELAQDRLHLTPCGCTFAAEAARREMTNLRARARDTRDVNPA